MKGSHAISNLVWTLFFLVYIPEFLAAQTSALMFELRGTGKASELTNNEAIPRMTFEFNLTVSNCLWLLREQKLSPPEETNLGFSETGTDGTNCYFIDNMVGHTTKLREKTGTNTANSAVGIIFPGTYPPNKRSPFTQILYMAYTSSCFLDGRGDETLLPPISLFPPGARLNFNDEMEAKIRRKETFPFLPIEIVYIGTRKHIEKQHPKASKAFLDLYPERFTNGMLRCYNFTNVGGSLCQHR